MKVRNTVTRLITMAIAMAAMAVTGSIGTAEAQHVRVFDGGGYLLGFIPGQTLRFSVYNPNVPERGSASARVQVRLYDEAGNVLAHSAQVELPPGQFRSIDFNGDGLPARNDPGTGRQQVHISAQFVMSDGSVRISPEHFPISVEIVDNQTGKTISAYPGFTGGVTVAAGDVND